MPVLRWYHAYRPISLITLDCPIKTEIRLPNALNVIKKLSPRAALVPKTAEKNRLAVTWSLAAMRDLGTVHQWLLVVSGSELTSSEVGDVAKYIEDSDNQETQGRRSFNGLDGVLDFRHYVESVLVTGVGEGDID
jgi:hypothetical protein